MTSVAATKRAIVRYNVARPQPRLSSSQFVEEFVHGMAVRAPGGKGRQNPESGRGE
jgi:hypothetical protein